MIPRRRKPPLLEALGDPPARAGRSPSSLPAPGGLLREPVSVTPKPVVHQPGNGTIGPSGRPSASAEPRLGPAAGGPGHASGKGWARNRSRVILFLIATLIGLFAITWSLAYRMGHQSGQQSVLSHTDPKDAAAITGQTPVELPPTGLGAGSGPQTGVGVPRSGDPNVLPAAGSAKPAQVGMPAIVGKDPRKPGWNYLEVCLLTWRDAEPAVRFLQSNGVRATAVPAGKGVDAANPQPKNPFLIIVDQPFASGKEYRASQAERDALKAEIRRLGRKWQTEHRGASDFREPEFRLQKGGK